MCRRGSARRIAHLCYTAARNAQRILPKLILLQKCCFSHAGLYRRIKWANWQFLRLNDHLSWLKWHVKELVAFSTQRRKRGRGGRRQAAGSMRRNCSSSTNDDLIQPNKIKTLITCRGAQWGDNQFVVHFARCYGAWWNNHSVALRIDSAVFK